MSGTSNNGIAGMPPQAKCAAAAGRTAAASDILLQRTHAARTRTHQPQLFVEVGKNFSLLAGLAFDLVSQFAVLVLHSLAVYFAW